MGPQYGPIPLLKGISRDPKYGALFDVELYDRGAPN